MIEAAGFEVYLVGGCTRDLLLERKPKDWDATTNATPEEILKLFGDDEAFYENDYGTVTVKNEDVEDLTLRNVEITPYRLEAEYSNNRHPDSVSFSKNLEDDLKRRDFTVNAIAYSVSKDGLVDPYSGLSDIKDKVIRAVGNAEERFTEDALRILRAVRLATELGFTIEAETSTAIATKAELLEAIAVERIQVEFTKMINSPEPMVGIAMTQKLGLLKYIIPELEEGIDCEQNGDHIYDVWEHNLRSLQHAAEREWPFHVRLAALLHDIGKPRSRQWSKDKNNWTFYGHEVIGAKIVALALERLKYSKQLNETVSRMVRHHMFFSDPDKITLSAVRRIITKVGEEYIWDLVNLRVCDRKGMGRPKEVPYRLRKYESMIEEALRDPITVGKLKIDGSRLMEVTRSNPSPKIGHILHALLDEILENPELNTEEYLEKRAQELIELNEKELKALGDKGRDKKAEEEENELAQIRKDYRVQ